MHLSYRADIDGLRGLAILAVICFHVFPEWCGGGFVGVDIFFVISGYLITGIITDDLKHNRFSFKGFYARRIKRLFPGLLAVLIATLLCGWLFLFPGEFRQLGEHVFACAGFVSNFVLWKEAGYFDVASLQKPLLHLWSLGIEEQFYIAWPLILVIAYRYRFNLVRLTLAYLIVSFAFNIARVTNHPIEAFYLPWSRFWELSLGSLLSINPQFSAKLQTPDSRRNNYAALAGLFLIFISILSLSPEKSFPGLWALLPTVGAMLIIAAGPLAALNQRILGARVFSFIGKISYPLYLWHWPLLSFATIIETGPLHFSIRVFLMLISAFLACLTYWFIETPVRRDKKIGARTLAISMCAIAAIGGICWKGYILPRSAFIADPNISKILLSIDEKWPFPEPPLQKMQFEDLRLWQYGAAPEKVLFFGDSNMEQYWPRIHALIDQHPERLKSVIFATIGGCPPLPDVEDNAHPHCKGFVDKVRELARDSAIDTIILAAQWYSYFSLPSYYYAKDGYVGYFDARSNGLERASASFEAMLMEFYKQGKKVVLVLSVPVGQELDIKTHINRNLANLSFSLAPGAINRNKFEEKYALVRIMLQDIAKRSHAAVIDPVSFLCADHICPVISAEGELIYRDANHLYPGYVRNHIRYLDSFLLRN
jgi:peptidoglycan/LPS O-acetylase OafA/YrhL